MIDIDELISGIAECAQNRVDSIEQVEAQRFGSTREHVHALLGPQAKVELATRVDERVARVVDVKQLIVRLTEPALDDRIVQREFFAQLVRRCWVNYLRHGNPIR